jgi:hypothetical protein
MGLCSSAATPDTTAIDLSAFCARLKLNYLNMPILIIKQEPSASSKYQIDVDGTLPQDVIELGFVKVDDKFNTGLQAEATQIPSMAALLSSQKDGLQFLSNPVEHRVVSPWYCFAWGLVQPPKLLKSEKV